MALSGIRIRLSLIIVSMAALLVLTSGFLRKNDGPIYFVEGRPDRVALTFGTLYSSQGLTELLAILDREEVKATFFLSGEWLKLNPDPAKRILLKGHEIGNSPVSCGSLLYLDEESLVRELRGFDRLARGLLEYRPRLFRPPRGEYGGLVEQVARQEGYTLVLGTIEAYDWLDRGDPLLPQRVLERARGGSIISFYVGSPPLVEVLPQIISSLREQGLEPVTLSRLGLDRGVLKNLREG